MAKKDITMWSAMILIVVGLIWLFQEAELFNFGVSNGIWLPLLGVLYGVKKLMYK